MKTIIAGSRGITDYDVLLQAIEEAPFEITSVVSGRARGADTLGEQYAIERGIPLHLFPADWNAHGRKAGPMRNEQMAEVAEAVLCIWDGSSRGTQDMINRAKKRNLPLYVFIAKDDSSIRDFIDW